MNRTAPKAVLAALVVALAALASPLRAQQSFSTTVYFDYVTFLSDKGPITVNPLNNRFSFRRAYFTYENRWGDLRFRFRYDADNATNITSVDFRNSTTRRDEKLRPYMKHLYMQYDNLIKNSTIRVGMAETLTFKPAEDRWGFRSVAKTLVDNFRDVTGVDIDATSAEIGVSMSHTPSKYFRYAFQICNGNHYTRVENDRYKKFLFQGTVVPAAGLSFVGYADYEKQTQDSDSKTYKLDVNFEMVKNLTLVFEWFNYNNDNNKLPSGTHYDVRGWSAFGRYVVTQNKLTLFVRHDQYEPNTKTDNNKINLVIAGFEWQPTDKTALKIQPNLWYYTYEHPDRKNDLVAVITFFMTF